MKESCSPSRSLRERLICWHLLPRRARARSRMGARARVGLLPGGPGGRSGLVSGGLLPRWAAFSGSWMMQLICCRTKVLLIRGEPLITGDCTFPKNLRYEIWADLSPMVIRYAHKIISTNHVVVIRTRKRPFKSNILQSLDKLGSGYWHKSTQ